MFGYIRSVTCFLVLIFFGIPVAAQMPAGFHWVDFKKDPKTLARIEKLLEKENYSAIREIGVVGDSALVFVSSREPEQELPGDEATIVYNVSLKNASARKLLFGYKVEFLAWLHFQSMGTADLGLRYFDCWECEPATMFTALHHDVANGWRARWENPQNKEQPGILFQVTDVGDPYTDEDVDQMFGVFAPEGRLAAIATWYHSRDLKTTKVTNEVRKFSVDPKTGNDVTKILTGPEAVRIEVELCDPKTLVLGRGGQDSKTCKNLRAKSKLSPQ